MRRTLVWVLRVLMSLSAVIMLMHAQQEESKGRKYSLLIGEQKFDGNSLRNLKFCENHVTQLAEVQVLLLPAQVVVDSLPFPVAYRQI